MFEIYVRDGVAMCWQVKVSFGRPPHPECPTIQSHGLDPVPSLSRPCKHFHLPTFPLLARRWSSWRGDFAFADARRIDSYSRERMEMIAGPAADRLHDLESKWRFADGENALDGSALIGHTNCYIATRARLSNQEDYELLNPSKLYTWRSRSRCTALQRDRLCDRKRDELHFAMIVASSVNGEGYWIKSKRYRRSIHVSNLSDKC